MLRVTLVHPYLRIYGFNHHMVPNLAVIYMTNEAPESVHISDALLLALTAHECQLT